MAYSAIQQTSKPVMLKDVMHPGKGVIFSQRLPAHHGSRGVGQLRRNYDRRSRRRRPGGFAGRIGHAEMISGRVRGVRVIESTLIFGWAGRALIGTLTGEADAAAPNPATFATVGGDSRSGGQP